MIDKLADKLFTNAIILSQDVERPEATQLAIRGNKILAIGSDLECHRNAETEVFDLQGAVITPGFVDAHIHFLWGGESLLTIPLQQANTKGMFKQLISDYANHHKAGVWLKGGGWNEHLFEEVCLPTKDWLDEAAPGHPMILHRHDGHSGIASSRALELAGISRDTPDPIGGVIDRDEAGEPTGILRDSAMGLVMKLIPEETEAELSRYLEASQNYLLSKGVNAVGDMIYDLNHFLFLEKMARQKKLKLRVTAYAPILKWGEVKQLLDQGIYEDEWFQFKGLKGFADGSLGSHTALMMEPYLDNPGSIGIYDSDWDNVELIRTNITEADQRGYQTVIHAIGDRANREVLDLFEGVILENGPRDRRFRIEHAQHIHGDDQARFAKHSVIASVQPAHCVDDARYADDLLGKRSCYAYPFRSLQKRGAHLAFGSDWPVSPADPIATIHGAIKRANWHMEEAVDFNTALKAHTIDAAFAGFREGDLGMLRAGHLADFVILEPKFLQLESFDEPPKKLIQKVFIAGQLQSHHSVPNG